MGEQEGLSILKGWERSVVNVEQPLSENPDFRDFNASVESVGPVLALCASTRIEHRKKIVFDLAGAELIRFASPGWVEAVRILSPSVLMTIRKWPK
jgi:hypothetical protein